MLLSLFLLGTVWFWLLLGAAAIVIGVCMVRESFAKATFCLLGFFLVLMLFGDFNVIHWLAENGTTFLIGFGVYLAAGLLVSIAKWFFFVQRTRDEYLERRRAFLDQHDVREDKIPERLKARWQAELAQSWQRNRRNFGYPPRARDYKGKITAWMMYWPWTLVVFVLSDFLRKMVDAVFRAFQRVFQGISDRAFKGVEDDFSETPPVPGGNGTPPAPTRPGDDDVSDGRPRDAL